MDFPCRGSCWKPCVIEADRTQLEPPWHRGLKWNSSLHRVFPAQAWSWGIAAGSSGTSSFLSAFPFEPLMGSVAIPQPCVLTGLWGSQSSQPITAEWGRAWGGMWPFWFSQGSFVPRASLLVMEEWCLSRAPAGHALISWVAGGCEPSFHQQ